MRYWPSFGIIIDIVYGVNTEHFACSCIKCNFIPRVNYIGYQEQGTVCRCCFAAMVFRNCTADPSSGNVLTSPEFTLSSSQQLTFTMSSVQYYSNYKLYSPLAVYKTSVLGHVDTLLGSYYPEFNASDDFPDLITYTTCLPVGTHQLVFVASGVENVSESIAAIKEVRLTDSSCTYTSQAGVYASACTNIYQLAVFQALFTSHEQN